MIEANSVGTPAVALNVAGLRDSVRDGVTGGLAAAGDPKDLGRTIVVLSDPDSYAALSRNAVEWAERFSSNDTARRLFEIVERR